MREELRGGHDSSDGREQLWRFTVGCSFRGVSLAPEVVRILEDGFAATGSAGEAMNGLLRVMPERVFLDVIEDLCRTT